jgi:lipopolysaccharide cholinephosphotransferase
MTEDMKVVQDKILEIALYLDEFCREHEITYYLMGGSALGAIRHQGFIPWDDDLDVFMTYDNYTKFIKKCEQHLDTERFYFQKEDTEEWPLFFSKLRMNNTTFIEEDTKDRNMHKGFYVDIMCLNNAHSNKFLRYIQYVSARLITARTLAVRGYITDSKVKKVMMFVARSFVRGYAMKILLGAVRGLNRTKTDYVGHFFGRAKFGNTSFPKEYLGKQRYVEFSNHFLPVPEKAEEYLTMRYGKNYMEMPDKRTRDQYPVHAFYVDTEKDYSFYDK